MYQLTKDILFLLEFVGELPPEKLNKLVEKHLDNEYNMGYKNGVADTNSRFQYPDTTGAKILENPTNYNTRGRPVN